MLGFEYTIRILLYSLIFYIVVKHAAPVIFQSLYEKLFKAKTKENNLDFDLMVERKKSILRGKEVRPSSQESKETKTYDSSTHEAYAKEYKFLSSSNEDTTEVKKVLTFLDQIQWGSGKESLKIKETISKSFQHRFDLEDIQEAINFIIKNDTLLKLKAPGLPPMKEIMKSITYASVAKQLFLDSKNQNGNILKYFSKASDQRVIQSFYQILLNSGLTTQEQDPSREEFFDFLNRSILSGDEKSFSLIKDLKEEVRNRSELLDSILPLNDITEKSSLEAAYQVFGLKKTEDTSAIKKRYKQLAKLKHPDILMTKGIPEEFLSTINDNFTKIKIAYDIIIKELK